MRRPGKSVCVVLPTYNAKRTIISVLKKIRAAIPNCFIVVVDDNSPDQTAGHIKKYFKARDNVQVIVRKEKGGRGSAVIRGFIEGLKNKNHEYFIEMDADLCHHPKFIPHLVRACSSADITIASRYMKKSKNIHWNLRRQIFSRTVSLFLRLFLGVPISDYTNGFRCYRRRAVVFMTKQRLIAKGFFVLSETAYKLYKKGFSFTEVPFTFQFYERNPSNLNMSELKEAILTVFKLKFPVLFNQKQS